MKLKGRTQNKLENWEIALVKAMIANGINVDQDILAYFTRPTRSINHARIGEIRNGNKHGNVKTASAAELKKFLAHWPHIDTQTGLHILAEELIIKSREAMLLAVQSYNNPKAHFRSEVFIVTAMIAWTYLLHAYFKKAGVDHRYKKMKPDGTEEVHKTKHGAECYWDLTNCLQQAACPVDAGTKNNLSFLIEIRHEIEHRMTTRIDSAISAKLQACCMNYNRTLKNLFGEEIGLDGDLSFALQFSSLNPKLTEDLIKDKALPAHIEAARASIEDGLSDDEYKDPNYAYRVMYVPKVVNKKAQADEVIQFVSASPDQLDEIGKVLVKETDRKKFRPGQVVKKMREGGFPKFAQHHHTELWQALDAKNPGKGYGVETESDGWRWYEKWIDATRQHCEENKDKYQ